MIPQAKENDMTIVLQKPGSETLYVSDLIDGRFQVLESSAFRNYFYIYDHAKDETQRNRDGSTLYFTTSADALAHLAGTPVATKPSKAEKAPKALKPAKAEKPAKEPKAPKAEKAPRKARVVTAGEVDVRERKERPGSMLSVIRGLIRKGGDDEAVFKELKELHPTATYGLKTIAILRKEMGLI
jgi:hypothetical protein